MRCSFLLFFLLMKTASGRTPVFQWRQGNIQNTGLNSDNYNNSKNNSNNSNNGYK